MSAARRPRWVLGVNPGPHDGSAALLRDGRLYAMAEQERFSHPLTPSPPALDHAGIRLDELAGIALSATSTCSTPTSSAPSTAPSRPDASMIPGVLFPHDRFPVRFP